MALARWQSTITDGNTGKVVPNATVEVRSEIAGSPLARLFSDRQGTVPAANPITADANGYVYFHVTGGAYRITATKGAFSREWRYVGIGRNQESDLVGLRPAGEWDVEHAYDISDFVMFSSLGFVSKQSDNLGNEPPSAAEDNEFWMYVPLAAAEAELAREKAQEWAEEDENVPVETGQFSAKHHALKSAASAVAAAASKAGADTAKTGADLAKAGAETARDASFVNAQVYADEATGRAAVANGAQFAWLDGNEVVRSTRVSSTVSTEVARFPTSGKLTAVFDNSSVWYNGPKQVLIGWIDSNKYVISAKYVDGTLDDFLDPTHFETTTEWYAGYEQVLFGAADIDGRILYANLAGGGSFDTFMASSDLMGNETAILTMGDSLTQSSYPSTLATLTGRTVINIGRGSQGTKHGAARIGAIPLTMRVSGSQIVAGSNSITHINGYALSGGLGVDGSNQFLSRGDSNATDSVTGRLGSVHGTLTRTASGGPPSTIETYTFVPDSGEYLPAKCPNDTVWLSDHPYRHLTHVIWLGSNDIGFGDVPTRFDPYISAIIQSLGHNKYLALSPISRTNSDPTWQQGGTWWLEVSYAAKALAGFARKNFVPLRRMLIDQALTRLGITPTTQDTIDISNDMIPTSIKLDFIHHNANGNAVIAEIVDEELEARGY